MSHSWSDGTTPGSGQNSFRLSAARYDAGRMQRMVCDLRRFFPHSSDLDDGRSSRRAVAGSYANPLYFETATDRRKPGRRDVSCHRVRPGLRRGTNGSGPGYYMFGSSVSTRASISIPARTATTFTRGGEAGGALIKDRTFLLGVGLSQSDVRYHGVRRPDTQMRRRLLPIPQCVDRPAASVSSATRNGAPFPTTRFPPAGSAPWHRTRRTTTSDSQ